MDIENTIKGKEVIAYKGMEFDMSCKWFHYEIGKSYKTDKAKLCEWGFHACLNPLDVFGYYPKYASSRYFKVKLSGEITKCTSYDTQVAATEITILEEIPSDKFLTNTEWWKNKNVLDLLYYSDGFARVKNCERKYNFIDKKGKLLSKQWFDRVDDFKEGFAVVEKTIGLRNYIDKYGKLLSDEWFNNAHSFKDGLAKVQRRDGLWNFINKKGKFLSNEWFNWVGYFCEGFAGVRITNGEWRKIDKTGKLYRH